MVNNNANVLCFCFFFFFQLIKNVKKHDVVLLRLPAFEKAVSQVLLDIKVGRRCVIQQII